MTHKLKNLEDFKGWVRAGIRVHPDHAIELADRVQSAEAEASKYRGLYDEAESAHAEAERKATDLFNEGIRQKKRAIAAEAKLAAVRELHSKTPVYDDQCDDADCGQEHFEAMDSELYHCATAAYYACEECHKMTDGELDEYPCPTIRALDGAK